MVMGLAPIFLLSWLRSAGMISFHMAFWPGVGIGVIRAIETFGHRQIFPDLLRLGSGPFALDLGVNVWGLALCTAGFVAGALLAPRAQDALTLAQKA
jgi:SSS family solute:Na+ symporter